MKALLTKKRLVLLSFVMVILLGTVLPIRADGRFAERAMMAPVQSQRTDSVTDDTFTACLARIPAQALSSSGCLAERKCQIEEKARQFVPLVVKEDGRS